MLNCKVASPNSSLTTDNLAKSNFEAGSFDFLFFQHTKLMCMKIWGQVGELSSSLCPPRGKNNQEILGKI